MISHYRRLNVFIIKRKNYKEADKIITVFSQKKGKMVLLAKGIRKTSSKRSAILELFNQVDLVAAKTPGMDVITEVNLSKDHSNFSQNFDKTKIAYRLVELVDRLTTEKEEHEELFFLIKKAFNYLDKTQLDSQKADKIALRFKLKILQILGFGLPQNQSLENLSQFIENIIEKKLVSRSHFS